MSNGPCAAPLHVPAVPQVKRQIENKLRVQQWERERAQEERQQAAAEGGAATELPEFLKKQPEHHQCDHKH